MSQDQQSASPKYNRVFERIHNRCQATKRSETVAGLAYAFYKNDKVDWIKRHWAAHSCAPNAGDFAAHEVAVGDVRINDYVDKAEAALARFAAGMISASIPEIQDKAVRGLFWPNVWSSVLGSAIFALILTGIGIVLVQLGIAIPIPFRPES